MKDSSVVGGGLVASISIGESSLEGEVGSTFRLVESIRKPSSTIEVAIVACAFGLFVPLKIDKLKPARSCIAVRARDRCGLIFARDLDRFEFDAPENRLRLAEGLTGLETSPARMGRKRKFL